MTPHVNVAITVLVSGIVFTDFNRTIYVENNTWACGDMEFPFSCSTDISLVVVVVVIREYGV